MKKIAIAILSLLITCSCESFLDVEKLGVNTIEGFFSTIEGLKSAGVGLHSELLEFYDNVYLKMGDVQGDKVYALRSNAGEAILLVYDFESLESHDGGFPYTAWNKGYNVITNANEIILYAPKLLEKYPRQAEVVNTELGYAYFVRGCVLFNLCNIYSQPYDFTSDASHLGVVPVSQIPSFEDKLARASIGKCYDRVIKDLETALEYFGDDTVPSVYYASGLACEAMLARVYLYMKDYESAAKYSSLVMSKVSLTPRSSYVDMFRQAQNTPGEAIFRLNTYDEGASMRSLCDPTGNQDIRPDEDFVNTFSDDDIRKKLMTFVGEKEDDPYEGEVFSAVCKYLPYKGVEAAKENRRADHFVLRVSEMYLIHAEALCLGKEKDLKAAEDDVKAIRARALGVDPGSIALSYSNAAELDRIIQEERAKELCFEGHRFFDLKRRHEDIIRSDKTSSNCKKLTWPSYRYAMPIAHLEMQANPYMVQTEGYNEAMEQ